MKRKPTFILLVALMLVSFGFITSPPFMLHEQLVHVKLNELAADLLKRYDEDKLKGIYAEIYEPAHRTKLGIGGHSEDVAQVFARVLHHFYHPRTEDAYLFNKSALEWAYDSGGLGGEDLTWQGAIASYEGDNSARAQGSKEDAYKKLGHVAHLVGDMSQPDHVHLEAHIHNTDIFGLKLKDDPYEWESWGEAFSNKPEWEELSSQLKINGEPLYEHGYQLDDYIRNMALQTYSESSFSGQLRKIKGRGNGASGELDDMFEVSYEPIGSMTLTKAGKKETLYEYGWVIRNDEKKGGAIIAWTPLTARGGSTPRSQVKGVGDLYDVCTETTLLDCFKPGKKTTFYIEDIEHAIPAEYPIGTPNTDNKPLAYFYARDLWPLAVQYIAGLYMHFHDIVNAPPYVKKVTAIQDKQTKYEKEWKTMDWFDTITVPREQIPPPPPPPPLKGESVLKREWSADSKSLPLDPEEKITIEITFSERVKGVKVRLEDFPDKLEAKAKNGKNAVDDSIWCVTLKKDDLKSAIIIPPDSTTVSRTLQIRGIDLNYHLARTVDNIRVVGNLLDSEPNSVAKATYLGVPDDPALRNKYGWSGYKAGDDMNHKLTFGKQANPVMFLLDTSGSMGMGKMQQAQNGALKALQTLRDNQEQGGKPSIAAIKTFSGGCDPDMALKRQLDFTTDLDKVGQVLTNGFYTGGGTPLHLATEKAETEVRDYLEKSDTEEGTIVLLTDGMDTCGGVRPTGVYSQAPVLPPQRIPVKRKKQKKQNPANVRYLTIGFGLAPNSPADRDLQYLAAMSGGRHFNAQNLRQLTRAFTKLLKAYIPKLPANPNALSPSAVKFLRTGEAALAARDYSTARNAFRAYTKSAPADPAGVFNLALVLEASDRYKGAAAQYRRYLQLAASVPDRHKIEALIPELEQDYVDYFAYQVELVKSDLSYLKDYYQRLFNQSNAALAAEFSGFVREKGEFYRNLPDAFELDAQWLEQDTRRLSRAINRIAKRINQPTFDRDAVSLLAVPIKRLEKIVEKLEAAEDTL